jgi:hypothetical protein
VTVSWRALALGLLAVACGGESGGGASGPDRPGATTPIATTALFVAPTAIAELDGDRFFEHPFPSDLRREADGTARFTGWPNPFANALITQYVETTKGLFDGFSPVTPVYLRFTHPIDVGSLPADPPASLARDAAVQLLDVDPASPERGQRRLVQLHFQETAPAGASYWQPNTLAVMPILGRPLRTRTRYAAVVTRKIRGKGGGTASPSTDLEEVVGTKAASRPPTEAIRTLFAPAVAELEAAGIPKSEIVHLSVFTTNDPTAEVFAAEGALKAVRAPTASGWVARPTTPEYDVYEGTYGPSPNYQVGSAPYTTLGQGGFLLEGGVPKVQNDFDARFALAVPNAGRCPLPAGGYPVVLYAHGTGGDFHSFLDDDTAQALAERCLASVGVDQIFHGTRPGAPAANDAARAAILFFNFDNPTAGRTNNRQSAIDVLQEARLFRESRIRVPANVSRTGAEIAFDADRILFFGHSQGGLNGPLFLAASDAARGGVLSGAGSVLTIALLEKTAPVDVAAFVKVLLGLASEEGESELNLFHPALALAQTLVDATDPIHYGAFITSSPRAGLAPKSIFQTEGIAADGKGDTFSPPHGIEALAVAMNLPRLAPGVRPIAEAGWANLPDLTVPAGGLGGNLGGGKATGALAQFAPPPGVDGHFVVFRLPEARNRAADFCQDLARDPVGRLR